MPHLHFVMDAYDTIEAQGDDLKLVNEMLTKIPNILNLNPIMPPVLIPYYYCQESEDVGVSAFVFLKNGHMTIHTFPKRSCYFLDILSESFFSCEYVEQKIKEFLSANDVKSNLIDRRFPDTISEKNINEDSDFGPHYLLSVQNCEMNMDSIFRWLDNVAEKINVQPISRPFVFYDNVNNPRYISGILIIAQSHVAIHYDMVLKSADVDIFSCSFLEDSLVQKIFKETFGNSIKYDLFPRGSKYKNRYTKKENRLSESRSWRMNIK